MGAKAGAANLITGTRILCSIALLFCKAFSPPFFALYVIAGLTDMIDGAVARKTRTVSEFGAKLDTAAVFVFVAVCLWKLLPKLSVPLWLWLWIAGIPTLINKVTGVLLFALPLTLPIVELKNSAPCVCAAATFAAVQEGHYIRTGREI